MRKPVLFALLPLAACQRSHPDAVDTGGIHLTDTAGADLDDADNDGFASDVDCDDANDAINPGADELCDGVDNNCDGEVDEGVMLSLFVDSDGDGHGASPAQACALAEGLSEHGDDCDDSEPLASPSQEEVCNDLIDNDCDGTSNDCAPSGLLSVDDALYGVSGDDAYDTLGWEVSGSPDIDGDGRGEVLIGALYGGSGDHTFAGAAYRISTPPEGVSAIGAVADVVVTSTEALDYLGASVRGGVDLDGDGAADWVASAPGDIVGHSGTVQGDRGEVMVFSGALVGVADARTDALAHITGHIDAMHAGYSVAVAEDDSGGALLIGAYQDSTGAENAGAAYLLRGPISGPISLAQADAQLVGSRAHERLGVSVGLDDLNGDGIAELLASGPSLFWDDDDKSIEDSRAGVLGWVEGPVSGTISLADADGVMRGEENDRLGYAFSVGDLDGDGYADLAVGAYTSNDGTGGAYLFSGPISSGLTLDDAHATVWGEGANEESGSGLDISEDLDGDGRHDLLLGAWGWPAGAAQGRAYLMPGPISGTHQAADARAIWEGDGVAALGFPLRYVPDTDGDGITDLVTGACYDSRGGDYAGAAWVFSGSGL